MKELDERILGYIKNKFGEYISEVCDYVILIGKKQTKPIYDGLMNKKYKKDNIHIINDVKVDSINERAKL